MRLATAQYPLTPFNDFDQWREHIAGWVTAAARQRAQLLLFPEYGMMELTSLLARETSLQEQIEGLEAYRDKFLEVFAELARQWKATIVAPSFPVREDGKVFNLAYVFSPKGLAGQQDKWFMTRFEDEEWGIHPAPTPELTLFEADWGTFGIQICYDIEFPIGAQALCAQGAGLVLAPSCTETVRGASRVHIGARARALENQCFTAVAQTIGEAPWSPAVDLNYGYAAIYAPPDLDLPTDGIVARMQAQQPGWLVQDLDFEKVAAVRREGQVFNFKDQQRLELRKEGSAVQVIRCPV